MAIKMCNPLQDIVDIVSEKYPDLNVNIEFVQCMDVFAADGVKGTTDFFGDRMEVQVSADLSIAHACDILAHELAHCIVGYEEDEEKGHGEEWFNAYDWIHNEYMKRYNDFGESEDKE